MLKIDCPKYSVKQKADKSNARTLYNNPVIFLIVSIKFLSAVLYKVVANSLSSPEK